MSISHDISAMTAGAIINVSSKYVDIRHDINIIVQGVGSNTYIYFNKVSCQMYSSFITVFLSKTQTHTNL